MSTPFGFISLDSALPIKSEDDVVRFTKQGLHWDSNIILDWKRRSPEGDYEYLKSRYFDGSWKFSLPYDSFTLETYTDVGLACCVFVVYAHDDGFLYSLSVMGEDGNWRLQDTLFSAHLSESGSLLLAMNKESNIPTTAAKEFFWILLDRIHYFNSCPSDPKLQVHVASDKNSRVNVRRANDNKTPVFEFKIAFVDNEPMIPRRPYQGGTHASPTMHLRRGHFRRHGGMEIWVNSCVVGLAKNGITIKAYHVS